MDRHLAVRALERRLAHLEQRIADKESRGERHKTSYDRSELSAIRYVLRELTAKPSR